MLSPTFRYRRFLAGFTQADACRVLAISPRNAQRYDRDGAPPYVAAHLDLYARGQVIPADQWQGWRFEAGLLVCPADGLAYSASQLRAAWFERQELAARRRNDQRAAQYLLF